MLLDDLKNRIERYNNRLEKRKQRLIKKYTKEISRALKKSADTKGMVYVRMPIPYIIGSEIKQIFIKENLDVTLSYWRKGENSEYVDITIIYKMED